MDLQNSFIQAPDSFSGQEPRHFCLDTTFFKTFSSRSPTSNSNGFERQRRQVTLNLVCRIDEQHHNNTLSHPQDVTATMTKNENAVQPPDKGLAIQNNMQTKLSEAPSLDLFRATAAANAASDLETSFVERANFTTGKVAIPRHRASTAPRYNRRVPRACESCRQRKTKCSGDTPVCQQCHVLGGTCLYPLRSTEKAKR